MKVNSLNSLIKFIKVIFLSLGRAGCPPPQEFQGNGLFPDRVSGAIADSAFPDNARIVEQVIAINFGEFMDFCPTLCIIFYI
ncbi:hypothetical protein [Microcoleus sp. POL10_C6]|uniref:hypothetical protein n=1 Tax=unclassified Microcoleus TaxID=2642155 RepID=UPI002FD77594